LFTRKEDVLRIKCFLLRMVTDDEKSVADRYGVILRPMCQTTKWIMGEDVYLRCDPTTTFQEIKEIINRDRRHLPVVRIDIYLNEKIIPKEKMIWTLLRLAVPNQGVLVISPTLYDGWYWNLPNYYKEKLLHDIALAIIAEPAGVLEIKDIVEKVSPLPRPVKTSVKTLLRIYPERFFMRTDVTLNKVFVSVSDGMQLPTFEAGSVDMGTIVQYAPRRFDWDDYASVDSMKKVVLNLNLPGAGYQFQIVGLRKLRKMDIFTRPNAYCIVYWNNDMEEEVEGLELDNFSDPKLKKKETEIVDDSYNPIFVDESFVCETGQLGEIEVCGMKIEVWHANLEQSEDGDGDGGGGADGERNKDYDELIGVCFLTGLDLRNLINRKAVTGSEYPIMPVDKKLDQTGTIVLNVSKADTKPIPKTFEVCINSCFGLKEYRMMEYARVLVVLVWMGQEIGSSPISPFRVDPQFLTEGRDGDIFTLNVPKALSLGECDLELQVWLTDANQGRGRFIGSALVANKELNKAFGVSDENPKGKTTLSMFPLGSSSSPTIPRDMRNPIGVQGSINITAGPPGLPRNLGKPLEVSVSYVEKTLKKNFLICSATWNNIALGISSPARLQDQDWFNASSKTMFYFSRSGNHPRASFEIPIEDGVEGPARTAGCELKVCIWECESGEDYMNSKRREAKLKTDPKGLAYISDDLATQGDAGMVDPAEPVTESTYETAVIQARPRIKRKPLPGPSQLLGQIVIKGQELADLLTGKYATEKAYEVSMDYDRDSIYQRYVTREAQVTLIGGVIGARTLQQRVFSIECVNRLDLYGLFVDKKKKAEAEKAGDGKTDVKKSTGFGFFAKKPAVGDDDATIASVASSVRAVNLPIQGEPVDIYCVVYWNGDEMGRTQLMSTCEGNVVFHNEIIYVPLTCPATPGPDDPPNMRIVYKPVQNTFNCKLEIEILDTSEGSLGVLKLEGRKVGALLETKVPQTQIHDLSVSTRFSGNGRKIVKGQIKLATCGTEVSSPFLLDDAKAAQKARAEAAAKKQRMKEEKAAKKAAEKAAKKAEKKKAKDDAKAAAAAKEKAMQDG
jgi:hypothetical protein